MKSSSHLHSVNGGWLRGMSRSIKSTFPSWCGSRADTNEQFPTLPLCFGKSFVNSISLQSVLRTWKNRDWKKKKIPKSEVWAHFFKIFSVGNKSSESCQSSVNKLHFPILTNMVLNPLKLMRLLRCKIWTGYWTETQPTRFINSLFRVSIPSCE